MKPANLTNPNDSGEDSPRQELFVRVVLLLFFFGCCCGGPYHLLKWDHTYLIMSEPRAKSMRFDGEEVESVFSFGEFFGTYEIAATFATGQVVTVEVYPRPGDDNSSQIRITPQGVVPYGDLRYKVISITKAKK